MFVYLPDRGRYAVLAALGALATGCTDPVQSTDLRPDGPPEVLAVMVMNDTISGLSESATFCKANDDKRPSLVGLPDGTTQQVCPLDGSGVTNGVTDAAPQGWFVRVVFDELLDPSIEDLTEILDDDGNPTGTYSGSIARTHPFKLQCQGVAGAMVDIPYDGYYSASGNNLTWPLGPSLVAKPNVPASVPSNSKCTITLNDNILDKNDGVQVPSDQRGPYDFAIGKIKVVAISPSPGDEVTAFDAGVDLTFNDVIDPALIVDDATSFAFEPAAKSENLYTLQEPLFFEVSGTPAFGGKSVGGQEFFTGADFYASTDYTFTIPTGTKFTDMCGVTTTFGAPSKDDNTETNFTTSDLKFSGLTPVDGTMGAVPANLIKMSFNQYMDPDSIPTTAWSLKEGSTDVSATATLDPSGANPSQLVVNYPYKLNTDYTFTFAASSIKECPGGEFGGCAADSASLAVPAQMTTFHTVSAIAMTTTSPASGSAITKPTPTSTTSITLNFNQQMAGVQPGLVQGTNFTIEPNIPLTIGQSNQTSLRFRPTAAGVPPVSTYPPGTYTFTLKKDTVLVDVNGAMYTQPSDLVIQFSVADPDQAPDCIP